MPASHRKKSHNGIIYLIIAIVIIAVLATYLAGASNPVQTISSSQQLSLSKNGTTYFTLPGNSTTYALFLSSSTNSTANLYLTATPIIAKPVQVLSLSSLQSANVSAGDTSTADMQIKLVSSTATSATVSVTPIPTDLAIPAQSFSILGGTQTQSTTVTTTVQTTTTTVTGGATSTVSTTATTTIAQSIPTSQILEVMNGSSIGQLMSDFNTLYIKDTACTPAEYNVSFQYYEQTPPSGPFTYYNVSPETPTKFNIAIAEVGSNLYNVTYTNDAPSSQFDVKILTAEVSTSSFTVQSYNFFQGLNLTTYQNAYAFEGSVTSNCGAYINP